jgi:hypothetical protein
MYRKHLLLIASLVSVLASIPGAEADDLCFQATSGGPIRVAKGVSVPPVDTCIQVTLFDVTSPYGLSTGSLCTSNTDPTTHSMGNFLLFHYTYDACMGDSYFESATCIITLGAKFNLPTGGGEPPQGEDARQSSCKGIWADLTANANPAQTGPVRVINQQATMIAWTCTNYANVPNGGSKNACWADQ